ncbi:MAG TPA: hypothetical protein VF147_18275 [Vicinamibacterales bacterium]
MSKAPRFRAVSLALLFALMASSAFAQDAKPSTGNPGWKVTVYPILAWVPTRIKIDLNLPQGPDNGGGSAEGGATAGEIVDSRFDGAFLGGISASKGPIRFDIDGMWAAIGGDRPERPRMSVDVDIIYGHATAGVKLYKALYVTGGVRRVAFDYTISLEDLPSFERKPGVWDPVVGIALHHQGGAFELHGVLEGGGFGVGADADLGASLRADWKPIPHFGVTAGYSFLYFKVSHELRNRTLIAKQTFQGPVVGLGLYF